ncbi:MBL fold metallo-hydrolase [Chitinivorax sp. B]|uniref:MBL fold metallo-hydrolase n=1 Tax=Chitinivorax sp. B TaxID=2502235 RepID=UPI0010F635F1|nr:MBL fold metallo-hydrolase [Chitinivorax sp. B]
MTANPAIEAFFDPTTWTISYVVFDHTNGHAAIIDPVLDFDARTGRIHTTNADKIIAFIHEQQLTVDWLLETHAHADHLSASHYLKSKLGGKTGISKHIVEVQSIFSRLFNLQTTLPCDGSQFDYLFNDAERFSIGILQAAVRFVPGHTPADLAYHIGDALFVGDTLFMPDIGTARCDFPGGNAKTLYHSIHRLLALPEDTRLFMCHDYPPAGRSPKWQTSVAEQRKSNIHVNSQITEAQFIAMREARDRTLDAPALLLPAIQVNIRAGELPPAESNGTHYLKIPLNAI